MTWHQDFIDKGYAVFPKLMPPALVDTAKTAILTDIREHYDAARHQEYESISWCPDIVTKPPIMDLLRQSPVWALLDDVLGAKNIRHGRGQVAIRKAHNASENIVYEYHIDGVPNGLNGLTGQEIDNFTALVGVFLTDIPGKFGGNLAVWPGSHYLLENYFREQGPASMDKGMPKVDLGMPVQIEESAGDVILCHYELAHTVASNTSDVDRIAVYFRIGLKEMEKNRWDFITHLWKGWKIQPQLEKK